MIQDKKVLAIIPARGGSKGLPRKNILPLLGKPLVAWSIEQAKESKYIDRIVVSSDDDEIIEVAKNFGAEVPFKRPKYLAEDDSKTIDVIFHTIKFYREFDDKDICVLLEPTSPLRDAVDIDNALELLTKNKKAESIVSVAEVVAQHPIFLSKLEEGFIRPYLDKGFQILRRQELDKLYFFEGSLYISYIGSLKAHKSFYHENCLAYIVPKWKSFEIDDEVDMIIVESLLTAKLNGRIK